jgi:hypothetical protein
VQDNPIFLFLPTITLISYPELLKMTPQKWVARCVHGEFSSMNAVTTSLSEIDLSSDPTL